MGWSIDETLHIGLTTFHFRFSDNVPTATRSVVTNGALLWYGTASISVDASALGVISCSSDLEDGVAASFTPISVYNSTGHLAEWTIELNTAYNITPKIVAHEFGHVIGLNDLYDDINNNKLMYFHTGSTATAPTTSDIWAQE